MRGKPARNKPLMPDKVYGSTVVTKLINYIMLDGKKTVAEDIVYTALELLAKETKLKPMEALEKSLGNIKPKIEVRSRRVGGANYQVPIPVAETRQLSLAFRWIIDASRASRGAKPYAQALANELIAASKREGAAYKKREDAHKMAEANKAFSHLTW